MSQKQITITFYFMDGLYDVEVYDWVEAASQKGRRMQELSLFGVDKAEGLQAIEKLKKTYRVMLIEEASDEDDTASVHYLEEVAPPSSEKIDHRVFWRIIDQSLQETHSLDQQIEWLTDLLTRLPENKTLDFCDELDDMLGFTKDHPHFSTAFRMTGIWGGDDTVSDFASWLVSQGEEVHIEVLKRPSDFEKLTRNCFFDEDGRPVNEAFQYIAHLSDGILEEEY